ncbi:hypothetical protein AVEN_49367-1 [Araneus ventricosus]|uniref:Uncharacterized protein n=1 Tax=Araneus ventricosus TaxID=182803 RepID=A0A4Y2LPH4_ARAVE|nr:hypothetical protein AVEN_49367-1 [Araneus ventricosus]
MVINKVFESMCEATRCLQCGRDMCVLPCPKRGRYRVCVGQTKKEMSKRRTASSKLQRLKTGGGRNDEKPLTPLDERILHLIGLDAADCWIWQRANQCLKYE